MEPQASLGNQSRHKNAPNPEHARIVARPVAFRLALLAPRPEHQVNPVLEAEELPARVIDVANLINTERPADRPRGVGKDWVPRELFAQRIKKTTVPSKQSKKNRFNVSPEKRKGVILCKPTEEQNDLLTTNLSAVFHQDEKRALCLAAEQWTDAFCISVNPSHARHVPETPHARRVLPWPKENTILRQCGK